MIIGVLLLPSDPVSGTGTGFGPLPSRERGLIDVVLFTRVTLWFPACAGVTKDMQMMICFAKSPYSDLKAYEIRQLAAFRFTESLTQKSGPSLQL